jgi:tetratricopeptide (TPR) repeat protein
MSAVEKLLQEGREKARQGLFEEAIACFEEAVSEDPESADARYYLAGVYFKQGNLGQARAAVKQALLCDPFHEKASALLQRLQPGAAPGKGESSLPRLTGGLALLAVIGMLIVAYGLMILHRDTLTREYGRVCGNIYHAMDVKDPITENWQPWRLVTGSLVVLVVAFTLIAPALAVSYLISCPLFAMRYNRWHFSLDIAGQLGLGAATLVLAVLLPYLLILVYIIKELYGPKTYILAGIAALLGVYQWFELLDQEKKRRGREG